MKTERTWKLHWRELVEPYPGLRNEIGDEVEVWIGFESADAVRCYVAPKGWEPVKVVRIGLSGPDGERQTVYSTVKDVVDWDTEVEPLPRSLKGYERPRDHRALRMDLMRAVRLAIDTAVSAKVISGQDGADLLLHTANVIERVVNRRQSSNTGDE